MERLKMDTLIRNHSQPQSLKRLYTISEAAIYLGRSIWSVRELIWKGELPSIKVGRRVHLDIKDLDGFIEQHKVREIL
ncbi:MAG: excisionase family DNA-binding protein [Nitrospirae bacterium]|nr:excisionase family DNA-binding protein [Candidatus Manganitrophaceae bacterium]